MTASVRLILTIVAAVAAFALLAVSYPHDPLASLDQDVAEWVATDLPTAVEWVALLFTLVGGWVGVTVLTAVTALVLVRGRAWLDLAFLLTAVIGSQLAVAFLKNAFDRERPGVAPAIDLPSSASFPSGHATSGTACLGAVAVLAAERLPTRARVWLWSLTAVTGAAVGASRVALGVHYVTDVLAGWCLGIAWLAGCLLARDALRGRYARAW